MVMELKTSQETLDEIGRIAESKGDSFQVRILRRNSMSDTAPETWCLLGEASALQIAQKEVWLHPLTNRGGGVFDLMVMHVNDPMKPIGSYLRITKPDSPRTPPDVSLMNKEDWKGPRVLIFPERAKTTEAVDRMPSSNVTGSGVSMQSNGIGNHAVALPQIATASSLRGTLSVSDEIEKRKIDNALADIDRRERFIQEETRKIELNNMMSPLQAQLQRMEAAVAQANQRAEDARKEAERRVSELASRPMVDITPKKSIMEELTPLLALVIPAYQQMSERSEKRQQEFMMMLRESSEKSAQNIKEVVEKLAEKRDDKNLLDLTAHVSQAFSTMSGMIVQMAHNVKDLQEPQPEQSGLVALAEAISNPLDKLANAYFLNAKRNADASDMKKIPPPPPAALPAAPAAAVAPTPSVEEIPMPNIEAIGSLIVMMQPPKNVVDYFFDHFWEADFQKLLAEEQIGGDPEKMLDYALQEWIKLSPQKNTAYLDGVKIEFRKQSLARGVAAEAKPQPKNGLQEIPQPKPATNGSSNDSAIRVVEPQVVDNSGETDDDDLTDDEAGEADDAANSDMP